MFNQLIHMANLSLKVNVMPGIVRDIDITLEELLKSFNTAWDLSDRVELIMGIDVGPAGNDASIKALAKVFNNLKIDNLTTNQLLILISAVKTTLEQLEKKKAEIVKELETSK